MKLSTGIYRYENILAYVILGLATLGYLFFLVPANQDLSTGVFQLSMDEQLSYDAVFRTLHPSGTADLFKSLVGGDQRYGKIIYNISALFAFLPEKLWGIQGQIIATRMLLFCLLWSAYWILARLFISRSIYQVLAVICMMYIPTTAYFAGMPKPEPFLLLFYAVFLFFYVKKGRRFGPHFIWLGIAFGCKISMTFALLFILLYTTLHSFYLYSSLHPGQRIRKVSLQLSTGLLFILAGWIIAIPILPFSIARPQLFIAYLQNTFLNTTHGTDDSTVNIISWIKGVFTSWLTSPVFLSVPVSCLLLVAIGIAIGYLKKKNNHPPAYPIVLAAGNALAFTLPILLMTKRLWFLYLHTGIAFFIITFFISIEILIATNKIHLKYFALCSTTALLFLSVCFSFPQQITEMKAMSERTREPQYLFNKKIYDYTIELLTKEKNRSPGKEITAFADPSFFRYDSKSTPVSQFWGYFDRWYMGRTFVFMTHQSNPATLLPPAPTNSAYTFWQHAMKDYQLHVSDTSQARDYVLLPQQIEGLYVYKHIDP